MSFFQLSDILAIKHLFIQILTFMYLSFLGENRRSLDFDENDRMLAVSSGLAVGYCLSNIGTLS